MGLYSVHESGGKGVIVSIETSLSNGLPTIVMVGFAGKSLDESRERIRSSFSSANIPMPRKRITINVSPSDLPKDGAHYDLGIALSILDKAKMVHKITDRVIVFGELGLDGDIKPVRGVLGKILAAVDAGFNDFIIPRANIAQAKLIHGIKVMEASNLKELFNTLSESAPKFQEVPIPPVNSKDTARLFPVDFAEVVGQMQAKRAFEIAAAGGHNVLLNGPPGVGKSMLAKAFPSIMSLPSQSEVITMTHIHSLSGSQVTELVEVRPFRAPHHSSSDVSIIGGGQNPRPGEVSLAHGGVLFLDEFPEFRRGTIESLRQPLEDGLVTVARAKESITYPARFTLIATKNPCPCGYYGSTKMCSCSPIELQRYQKKLSGPIMDRIDVHVTVENVQHDKLLSSQIHGESSNSIRDRVKNAQKRQEERLGSAQRNAFMTNREIKKHVHFEEDAKDFFDRAAEKLKISARVYMKLIKLAQTIADLEETETITKNHIAEALQYRPINTT